jgi:hypothetical protein
MSSILDRRAFIRLCSACAAFLSQAAHPQAKPAAPVSRGPVKNRKNFVGIQTRSYAWVDEGIDQVLDNMQQKGDVNTVWAYTFGYAETHLKKGGPIMLPDHGISGDSVTGGVYYDYDAKYFGNTTLKEFRVHDYGKFNVIADVAPKAKARGMDFFAWELNNSSPTLLRTIPGFSEITEIDLYGRKTAGPCFNHPNYRAWLTGKVESVLSGYSSLVDGYAWGSERMGPFENVMGRGGNATCFCEFCRAKARERGISVDRAQAGYHELVQLYHAAAQDQRPVDGYFVSFWRLLLRYPEILSWETLWTDSFQEVQAELYGTCKGIAPEKPFGFHIMESMTFSPFYRAEEDYVKRRNFADFLKPATYNNAGGPRLAAYLGQLGHSVFHDAEPKDFIDFYYKIMDYKEAPYDELSATGLSADYVARETRRAVTGVAGQVKIYPGIDIDVPTLISTGKNQEKRTSPDDVRRSIRAAIGAGADGVVLSRDYVEMWLANLSAAGETLRELYPPQAT